MNFNNQTNGRRGVVIELVIQDESGKVEHLASVEKDSLWGITSERKHGHLGNVPSMIELYKSVGDGNPIPDSPKVLFATFPSRNPPNDRRPDQPCQRDG